MEALDVPLDTLVKKSKISSRGGRKGSRGRGGAGGRIQNRGAAGGAGNFLGPRTSGLFRKNSRFRSGFGGISKPNRGAPLWPQQQHQQQHLDEGARLFVSNLDSGVSNEDIRELFSHIGELKYCSIHYDKSGRSKGTAEVCFARKDRAVAAISQYHNVQLDGKPMIIDMIGAAPSPAPVNGFAAQPIPRAQRTFLPVASNRGNVGARRGRGGGATRARGRGRGRGGGRGGRTNNNTGAPKYTVEELNADLDKYHLQAMDVA